jgi:hypothetical protein
MGKLLYRVFSLLCGVVGGLLAGAIFKQVWKRAAGEEEAPSPTDESRHWGEILAAAAVQGAIVSAVRAGVNRSGAAGVRKLTGAWPE